jgi:hypothetical protein
MTFVPEGLFVFVGSSTATKTFALVKLHTTYVSMYVCSGLEVEHFNITYNLTLVRYLPTSYSSVNLPVQSMQSLM